MRTIDRLRRTGSPWGCAWGIGVALLGTVSLSAPALAGGDCYRAQIPGAIALPDGSRHPRGELRICKQSEGSDLHFVRLDGHPVGAFVGREGRRLEGAHRADHVVFVFVRNADSELKLLGFAHMKGGRYRVFHLTDSTEWLQALKPELHDAGAGQFVLIATGR